MATKKKDKGKTMGASQPQRLPHLLVVWLNAPPHGVEVVAAHAGLPHLVDGEHGDADTGGRETSNEQGLSQQKAVGNGARDADAREDEPYARLAPKLAIVEEKPLAQSLLGGGVQLLSIGRRGIDLAIRLPILSLGHAKGSEGERKKRGKKREKALHVGMDFRAKYSDKIHKPNPQRDKY